jgi:molecular chaperone DnaK
VRPIGIDLGTTNTVIAVDGVARPHASEGGVVVPSVVAFPPSGATLVGTRARRRRAIDARNTIVSSKRVIGRLWHAPEVREYQARYQVAVVETGAGGVAFRTRAGVHTPAEVAAEILGVAAAEVPLDLEHAMAVVAVPSEFAQAQRDATADAARRAGFGGVQIVDEPVATALAYLQQAGVSPGLAAVYDLGGGTFDLAVVDCRGGEARVVGQGGDLYLGGDDIDDALARWAAERVLEAERWDLRDDPVVFDRLVLECERAKVRLSFAEQARIELSQVDPAASVAERSVAIDRRQVAEIAAELVRRTFVVCDEVLSRAGVRARDIESVFLAGGSTQLPSVRDAVTSYFGRPARAEIDPMEVVAIGASLAVSG